MRRLAPLFGVSKSTADRIIDHLGPMLALQPRKRFAKDAVLIVDGTLVPTRDHAIAERNTCTWTPALAKAGVIRPRAEGAKAWQRAAAPKDGFHVLRHTYASIMLEAGESVVTLARWLGHSSPAITLGYYAHFMPEAGSKGRGTIDGLLGERGGSAC